MSEHPRTSANIEKSGVCGLDSEHKPGITSVTLPGDVRPAKPQKTAVFKSEQATPSCSQCSQETDRIYIAWMQERRAARRRDLYANDPIWRLTKRKANWESRERKRRAGFINGRVDGKRVWIPAPLPQPANSEGVR